jgi:S1-C subfamily serine protease
MNRTFFILVLLWSSVSYAQSATDLSPSPAYADSVVLVRTESHGAGSGVVIAPNYVLTANHVVDEPSPVRIETGNIIVSATVVAHDPINDIALLKLQRSINNPSLTIRNRELSLNEQVRIIGFANAGWSATERSGEVIGIQYQNNIVSYLRITTPATSGMSGGPVLDSRGQVAAIIVAVTLENAVPTNTLAAPNHALVSLAKQMMEFAQK